MEIDAPTIGAGLGIAGVLTTLWINGDRTERQRRRDLHARSLKTVLEYVEMPFVIRRRRCEAEHGSEERVRISDRFSAIQAELTTCQVLLRADGDRKLSGQFDRLVATARRIAGQAAHNAWVEAPIEKDSETNLPELFAELAPFRKELASFEFALAKATLPRRKRWLARNRG